MTDNLPGWLDKFLHLCVILVFIIGLLCFFVRKQFIQQLVGLKLMLQSISLGLILTGWEKQEMFLSQSMIVSALIIEAVVMGLALTMIVYFSAGQEKMPGSPESIQYLLRDDDG